MRIAYVCNDAGVPVFGNKGCSIHVQEVLRALGKQGAQCEVFAIDSHGTPPYDLATVAVHKLPRAQGKRAQREQAALQANTVLQQKLMEHGPFDIIYERYALWSYAAMEYARDQGIPGVLEVNAPLIEEQQRHRGLIDHAAALLNSQRCFAAASAIAAVSDEVGEYLTHVTPNPVIEVVRNGVNLERFDPAVPPALEPTPEAITIGFVGSFKPWHGVLDLIQAFAQVHAALPQARLLLVGDGPQRAIIEQQLADRGLAAQAHFTGAVPAAAIPAWLTAMDIAVAPYPALEDFYFSPLKVYEYMAAGRAVIASRIGQLNQIIEHGNNGWLYQPGDIASLAQALLTLGHNTEQRRQLGLAARASMGLEHSWEHVAQHIFKLAQIPRPTPADRPGIMR